MYSKHTTGVRRYNMSKMSYALPHSNLIIFCKTLCYLVVIAQCVIENDNFPEKNMLHIDQQIWPCLLGGANLNSNTVM